MALLSNPMAAQHTTLTDEPLLHGHYTPYGHTGRTYTFFNDGRFETHKKGNEIDAAKLGKGTFTLKGKRICLFFEEMPMPGEIRATVEAPHTEEYKIDFEEDNELEVTLFRFNVKGPKRTDPRWQRTDEFIPYRLSPGAEDQE